MAQPPGQAHARAARAGQDGPQNQNAGAKLSHAFLILRALRLQGAYGQVRAAAVDLRAAVPEDAHQRFHIGDARNLLDDERVLGQKPRGQNGQHGVFGRAHLHLAAQAGRVADQIRRHGGITSVSATRCFWTFCQCCAMSIPSCRAHFDRHARCPCRVETFFSPPFQAVSARWKPGFACIRTAGGEKKRRMVEVFLKRFGPAGRTVPRRGNML